MRGREVVQGAMRRMGTIEMGEVEADVVFVLGS